MGKELTLDDMNRKNIRYLIENTNQITKNISSMVFHDETGFVYFKSESPKYERIGQVVDDAYDILSMLEGTMYNTLELAEYKKSYRYSTSTVAIDREGITIGQTEKGKDPDKKFNIHYIRQPEDSPYNVEGTRNKVMKEFYKKFPEVLESDKIDIENLGFLDYIYLSDEQMEELRNGEMISVMDSRMGEGVYAYITKALFPNINKTSSIGFIALESRSSLDEKCAYLIFREDIESANLIVYTLISSYQSI